MNSEEKYLKKELKIQAGPMINAYPDSIGGTLSEIVQCLNHPLMDNVFQSFYILPSLFNTDLDRGFSVIDYELNEMLASLKDIEDLKGKGMDFKFDFILNHASVLSKPFQDILKKGEASSYKDFFINWNKFWDGHGQMTEEGFVQPDSELIKDMFFRKPGLPILNVRMPDGKEVPYWNTFYQEVSYKKVDPQDLMAAMDLQYAKADFLAKLINKALDQGKMPKEISLIGYESYQDQIIDYLESHRRYLGQMDLNIKSPLVWEFYEDTLKKLAGYGAQIVRLDAFAYAPKEPGAKNFLNDPGTWKLLDRVKSLAETYNVALLPEIHSRYEEKIHEKISEKGYMTYDFFLPGLVIDAFENHTNEFLYKWVTDIQENNMRTVNMLGCHDGIPLLDLKGLLSDERIEKLIEIVVNRGGYVKDLHGAKNIYYQVNATYYSALGEDNMKLLLARAIQMFMPGKPQIWYLDLFAGKNDYEAVKKAGAGGHKEINRTNLSVEEVYERLEQQIVMDQLDLIKFRNNFPAFGFEARLQMLESTRDRIIMQWENQGCLALLEANLENYTFKVKGFEPDGDIAYYFESI